MSRAEGSKTGPAEEFSVKDSGDRHQFESGMVRDTTSGKVNYLLVRPGPMLRRWARHLTVAEAKYPPVATGVPNWTLAAGEAELERFRESAARHFEAWLAGERDEDHAAGVFFNVNGAEYVRDRLAEDPIATDEEINAVVADLSKVYESERPRVLSGRDKTWPDSPMRESLRGPSSLPRYESEVPRAMDKSATPMEPRCAE